jgi:hypothetical protein
VLKAIAKDTRGWNVMKKTNRGKVAEAPSLEKIRAQPLRLRKLARQIAKAKWDRQAPSAPQKRPAPQPNGK